MFLYLPVYFKKFVLKNKIFKNNIKSESGKPILKFYSKSSKPTCKHLCQIKQTIPQTVIQIEQAAPQNQTLCVCILRNPISRYIPIYSTDYTYCLYFTV
ncbi:hypothetical protein MsAg5_14100 [Methanosarcinaceae archaeon Ag5]|uniref:Uncharacterized protein n=1 Tax=Methanolapillus africanus TaxID=3028297 RepID=A0AAE4MJ38_9EURY|nr:hypothetical protein [Methanosarcinaceae archaeon Ag5]